MALATEVPRLRCESMTPFGRPVVPPVGIIAAKLSCGTFNDGAMRGWVASKLESESAIDELPSMQIS
ncbi:hypothetical protein D3C75_1218990 [compost metagenome]